MTDAAHRVLTDAAAAHAARVDGSAKAKRAFMARAYVSSSVDHRASYDEVRAAGHVDADGAITAAGLAAWGER